MFYRVSPDSRRPVIAKREFELIRERTKLKKIRYNFTWLSKERLAFPLPDTPKTFLKKEIARKKLLQCKKQNPQKKTFDSLSFLIGNYKFTLFKIINFVKIFTQTEKNIEMEKSDPSFPFNCFRLTNKKSSILSNKIEDPFGKKITSLNNLA